jgi:hypothetical protein
MYTTVNANKEQIDKIFKKHLKRVYNLEYTPNEDNIEDGIIWCTSYIFPATHFDCVTVGAPIIQWRIRKGKPMFFSIIIKDVSYEIYEPTGEFKERLHKLGIKAKRKFWKGSEI